MRLIAAYRKPKTILPMSNLVRNPPFLFTYWNPFSKDSSLVENWFDYVKNVSLAKYTADSVGRYMEQVSDDQINAIHSTGRRICGAFYEGFSGLQSQLGSVQDQLDQVTGQLHQVRIQLQGVNQRLGLLLDEAKTSNILQQNIAELLRIPDSQKQRQHHIELGLKFLKNALRDEDLYKDALRELLEAEKLMPTDYFVLHRIGMIYLYVPVLGNLEKALDYFVRAAKYAFMESHPDAARLSNILNKNVNTCFAQQAEPSSGDVSALAAESYHEAGTVLYTMGRFEEAVKMVEKAVKCQPGEGKYYFFIAKYLTRLGKPDSAVPQLQKAIELVPEIALATIGDFDLNRSQITLDLLETLNNSVNSQLTCGIQRLEKWSEANSRAGDTDVPEWITSARESLKEGTYSQKRELLAKLANYDDAMLAILPAYSKIMAFFNDAFIGQKRIKARLAKAVEAATRNSKLLGHILLLGPDGMGKATLAQVVAKSVGKRLVAVDASELREPRDLVPLLTDLDFDDGDVLLVNRIDQLEQAVRECLCSAMNEFKWEGAIDEGSRARSLRVNFPIFTLIGTALSGDQLSNKLLTSFSMVEFLDSYTQDENSFLTLHFATQFGIDPELAATTLGRRDNQTPQEIFKHHLQLKLRQSDQSNSSSLRTTSK
jgi:tetratricopeptide (TPR) repeat protein